MLTPVLIIGASLAAVIALGSYLQRLDAKRTAALQMASERLGWRFEAKPEMAVIPNAAQRELFTWGRAQKVRNHMATARDGRLVAVFDYLYTTGGGKNRRTWVQTVAHVHVPGLDLPAFALRPEHVFHRIGGMFGYQDIDLDADPEFSRRYLLRGADEAAIRTVFEAGVLDFYHRNPGSSTEGAGADLFFWRADKRVAPEDVTALVDVALSLADRFQSAAASTSRG